MLSGQELPEGSAESSLEELYFERDLELSTIDELKIWCRSLSLDDEGAEAELKSRLREYYSYDFSPAADSADAVETEEQLELIIESADSTEYYQIEDKGEEIHLTGSVKLTVNDKTEGREYVISADKIVFSRLDDSLTALGNVEYSRTEEGGQAERFLGESMTFHIEGWQGVIYEGVSSRTDSVDGEDVEFFFTGKEINSSGFDLAIMEKGTITSGNWEDPEYSIRAGKIWLLGPEEWGLVNGVIYLGRIPLLYLPFYYKPGNDMFFNPSIGFRTREGTTIQTTTYLIGQKDPENTSFFSAGLNSDSLYELDRHGLFLYKGEKTDESADESLKLMTDYYSRLGGFAGLEGEVNLGESGNPLELFLGIGVSRSIDDSNNYSVFFENDEGDYVEHWNSSYLGSLELPFRWGAEIAYSKGKFSLDLMYYSDPSFMGDFMSDRVENFDPLNFLLSDLGEDSTDTSSDINSFEWSLSWRKNITTESLSPWLTGINITRFNGSLDWSNETDELYDSYDDEDSPTEEFFYPESITFPDTAFSLSGTLWSDSSDDRESDTLTDGAGWRIPGNGEEQAEEESGDLPYELPELRTERTLSTGDDFSGSVSWSSTSTALMLNDFDNFLEDDSDVVGDVTPSLISFNLDKGKLSLTNKDSLSLDFDFFDNLLSLDHSESFYISTRTYLSLTGEDVDLTDSELKDQYSYDSVKWTNSTSLRLNPFDWYALSSSYVQYSLGMSIYEKSYDSLEDSEPIFDELWFSENEDGISKSDLVASLSYKPLSYFSASSKVSTSIYTDDRDVTTSMSNSLSLTLGPLSNSLSHGFDKTGDEWSFDSLSYKATLDLSPLDLVLTDSLSYDFENFRFESNTATLKGYGFTASLEADYTSDYYWESDVSSDDAYTWVEEDERFMLSNVGVDYSLSKELPPLWKNRINGKATVSTGWDQNLIKFNDSVLDFSLSLDLSIYEFTDISLSMSSENENMYLYIPAYRQALGIEEDYNLVSDLIKSFNFFNIQDRYDSFFNLKSFSFDLTHYLGNWNFILDYTGSPTLEDDQYEWQSTFSFYLQWIPIPTLNLDVDKDSDDDWDIAAGETD